MGLAHSRAVLFSRDARVRARRTEPIGRGVYVTCTIVYGVASLAQRALQVFQALLYRLSVHTHPTAPRFPCPVSHFPFPASRVPHPDPDGPFQPMDRWSRQCSPPPPPTSTVVVARSPRERFLRRSR